MTNLIISIILSSIAALIVYSHKKVTLMGTIFGWLMTIAITYIGGIKAFFLVMLTFLATIITKKLKNKNHSEEIIKKTKSKDAYQILANLLMPTISIVIYYFTNKIIFLIAFLTTIGSSLSDTLGSDVGVLSSGINRDIVTFKPIPKGLSGGISLLGTIASLIGAILVSITSYLLFKLSLVPSIYIAIIIFIGTLIDSFLGSILQVKYRCSKCKIITEKENHCNKSCQMIRGIYFINNDVVNFLSGLITFILTIIIM